MIEKTAEAVEVIHFDADLLNKALRYHLRESGTPDEGLLKSIPRGDVSAAISRQIWAHFDDNQRLSWLIDVCRAKPAPTSSRRTIWRTPTID